MPSVSFGPAVSTGSGATLTLLYDRIDNDANNAWLVNPRVEFYSKSGWSDSVNSMTSGGSAINGAQFHSGLINGGTRSWNVSAKAVPLTYGSETSVTFSVTVTNLSFYSGDSSSVTRTWNITFPKRPYQKPNPATNFTNTYINDNRVNLSWVANYTGGNGATPWINQAIERTETGDWADATQVGWLGWEPTSWSDTVSPNRRYKYRHKAVNPAGDSPYAYAPAPTSIYTTPAAPSYPHAQKTSDGSILVMWTNEAPWANSFEVSDSTDGATWTVLGTSSVSEYLHSAPNQSVTHRYRVRAKTPDGKWSAYSSVSNIVQLQAPPNAPTWGSIDPVYNGAETIKTPWTHNPVDTTPQTAYEVQHRTSSDNGATWTAWATTGKITSTSSTRTWAADTWEQNRLVQLQVRTWGAHATASPWSSSAQFRTSAPPTAAVTAPGTTVSSKRVVVSWNYADAEGTSQSSARVELLQGTTSLGLWELSGAGTSCTPPVDLVDATSYTVRVSVRDGHGLWSSLASKTFTTEFIPPPVPVVNVEWDEAHGAATVSISNPDPVGPQPAAVSNDVYRDGSLIAEGLPVDATFTDPLPLPAGSTYRVEAVSALPSTSETTVVLAPVEAVFRRFWLNSGTGWKNVASCWGNVKRGHSQGRNRVTEQYSGRELPVETIGEGRVSKFSLSGTLILHEDSPGDFFNVVNDPTPVHYRDRYGSWRVSPSVVDSDADNDAVAQITVTLTEVDSGGLL